MIEELGIITAVDKDHIWVETQIKTTCGGCQAQDNCGTGVVAKTFAPKTDTLVLRCEQPTKVGQQVTLGIEENSLLNASLLMYILPLFALILGALVGSVLLPEIGVDGEVFVIVSAFLSMASAFVWVRRFANRDTHHHFQPKLLAILPAKEDIIPVSQSH